MKINIDKGENDIFLVDFGISNIRSMTEKKNKRFIGTIRYASINAHLGNELSARDDL